MALTLGDVLVLFKGDTSNVDRAMARTESEATSWGQRLGGTIKRVMEIATGNLLANAGSKLAGMANNTLRTGFELVKNYELQVQSLQSLAARELMNTGAAKNMTEALEKARVIGEANIKWVEKLAIKSPFSSEDITGAYQMGAAMGINGDNLKILIQDTVDWAAASGKNRDAMNDVFLAIGQINTAGTTTWQDLMQLTTRGVPVWEYMAKSMGKTVPEVQKMVSKGLVPATVAIKALSDGFHGDFGGAAERMANSLAGLTGSLKDLVSITLRNLFQPALQAIQPYLAAFVNALGDEKLQGAVLAVGAAIGVYLVGALERLSKMVGPITSFAARVVSGFQLVRAIFTTILGPWRSGSGAVIAILEDMLGRISGRFAAAKMQARMWGLGTLQQFAAGMMAAFNVVVGAIKAIGSILSFWLKPNSPPKVAPDIDKWGQQTGEQYGVGIGRANVGKHVSTFGERLRDQLQAQFEGLSAEDMGLVEQLQGTIGSVLQSISKSGGMSEGAVTGIQKGLTAPLVAAVREMKETGKVSDETFKKLKQAAGPAGPAIEKITRAYFDLTAATKKVSRAQQDLNDIEKRYQELTKPVDAQLDEVGRQRQLISDQKRMMALQAVMMDASADGADRADAALEMQEIQLGSQKRAIEAQQKAETDVAQTKLDAATKEQSEAEARVAREEQTLKLYGQQADLSAQILAATKAAGKGQVGALKLVRDEVKGITDAVTDAKDKAESFADQIKASGDNAVARAKAFREQVTQAWARFAANPLVAGLIKLGTAAATFIQIYWKPLVGAIVGGAAAWAAPGLLVPIFGFIRILKLIGAATGGLGGILTVVKVALLGLFSPFNIIIALGALLGAAWGANFANIRRLTPELTKLGDLFKGVVTALMGGDVKGALGFLGPIVDQLGTIRGKIFAWIGDAVPLIIEKMKPWAQAFGSWIMDTALPWMGQAIGSLLLWLYDRLAAAAPPILAQLAVWGLMFGNWIITTALPWLGQKLGELITWLHAWIVENGPAILAQLATWATAFGSWVTDTALPWLDTKINELIAWLLDWIVTNGPGIGEKLLVWADMFGDWIIQTALPWLGEKIAELGQWLTDWIILYAPILLGKLGEWAAKFAEWVPIGIGLLIVALGFLLGKLLGWIVENGPSLLTTLGTWTQQFIDWNGRVIAWLLNEGLPALLRWIQNDLGPGMITGLTTMFGIIGTTIGELWSAAWAPGTMGAQLLTNLKASLDSIWPSLKAYFAGMLNQLNPWGTPPPPPPGTPPTAPPGTTGTTGVPAAPPGMGQGGGGGGGSKQYPAFAKGVRNFDGGMAWVGEDGPELLNLPSGSDVIPNNKVGGALRGAAAAGAQAHLHLSIQNPVVDSNERLAALVEQIRSTVSGDLERLITQITLDTL